jgi:hypothetical protein
MNIVRVGELFDIHTRAELVGSIAELAERHSPNNMWYLDCMIELITMAADMITERTLSNFVHLVNDWKDDTQFAAKVA